MSGGLNMYGFVKNNPLNYFDTYGLECKTTGSFDYEIFTDTKWSGIDLMPRINPGGKVGIGFFGVKLTIMGTVKGSILCERRCDGDCETLDRWTIDIDFSVAQKGTVGVGISFTPINLFYNTPYGAVKAITLAMRILKLKKQLENLLEGIKKSHEILNLICEWSR